MGARERNALCETGILLFGPRWQSDLARALGTSTRMMRYWVAGTHVPPDDLELRLRDLLQERVERIRDMTARLSATRGDR